jgi:6,7-dimethyl-8-ribityllumazine synthase
MNASPVSGSGGVAVVPSSSLRIVIVASRFNEDIVDGLVHGAERVLRRSSFAAATPRILRVPGAWELPLVALHVARSRQADAIVALGAVIRGETDHYQHIARAATDGLLRVMLETGIPVGFGVLTTDDEVQARARAGEGEDNKGAEAMRAVLDLLMLWSSLDGGEGNGS